MRKQFTHSVMQFLLVFLVVAFALSLLNERVFGTPLTPRVFVDPEHSIASVGSSIDVRVNISDGVGVTGYGIYMQFNPSLLVVTGWRSGGFLESSGVPTLFPDMVVHNYSGLVTLTNVLAGPGAASGNGALVILSFRVIGNGNCTLHIYNTELIQNDQNASEIHHVEADGSFTTPSTQGFPLLPVLIIVVVAILVVALAYGMKRARGGKTTIKQTARRKPVKRTSDR